MEIYFIIIILSLLSAIAFHKKKLWVWSAPILFLITEILVVLFNITKMAAHDYDVIASIKYTIPLFFGISLLFSGISAFVNHLKTKKQQAN